MSGMGDEEGKGMICQKKKSRVGGSFKFYFPRLIRTFEIFFHFFSKK